jgi:hypothetical protein
MVWKPKEKELTLEEAVVLAKRELAPLWSGSEPLVAAIRGSQGRKPSIFPLASQFSAVPRLFIFVDPTQPSSEFLLRYGREWAKRYGPNGCELLAIFRLPYTGLAQAQDFEELLRKSPLGFPVAIDRDGLLAEALTAEELPAVVLLHKGKVVFVDLDWRRPSETELRLQKYLRETDPGLPLRPAFLGDAVAPVDELSIELGRGRGSVFPAPGFQGDVRGFGTAQFKGPIQAGDLSKAPFFIQGNWIQDQDRIATSDPAAVLAFHASRANVAIVGSCLTKIGGTCKILIEVGERPVFDVFAGEAVQMDEDGNSRVVLEGLQLYPMLQALTPDSRRVTLRFPAAREFPIAIHGLRLWN